MTKRLIALVLSLTSSFSYVACGSENISSTTDSSGKNLYMNNDSLAEIEVNTEETQSTQSTALLDLIPDSNRFFAYSDRTAYITDNNELYVWGYNDLDGFLGLGEEYGRVLSPTKLMDHVISVSFGPSGSAAITQDRALYYWGYNCYDDLETNFDSYTPVKVMDNVACVGIGIDYTAALTFDGELYTWGSNKYGRAGMGSNTESSPSPVKIMDDVVSIEVEGGRGFAIKKDGTLYAWGMNEYGELGTGKNGNYNSSPVKIMDNVVAFEKGLQRNYAAITEDGSLYLWGRTECGQLLNGDTEDAITPTKIMDDVVKVSLGSDHCAALKTDGALYIWGCNTNGRLGDGTDNWSQKPIRIMDDVASFEMNVRCSSAITNDGSLYMWGFGELGQGETAFDESFTPLKVLDNVEEVRFGREHVAALTKDGSLFTWGIGKNGQLGNGTEEDNYAPVKVNFAYLENQQAESIHELSKNILEYTVQEQVEVIQDATGYDLTSEEALFIGLWKGKAYYGDGKDVTSDVLKSSNNFYEEDIPFSEFIEFEINADHTGTIFQRKRRKEFGVSWAVSDKTLIISNEDKPNTNYFLDKIDANTIKMTWDDEDKYILLEKAT